MANSIWDAWTPYAGDVVNTSDVGDIIGVPQREQERSSTILGAWNQVTGGGGSSASQYTNDAYQGFHNEVSGYLNSGGSNAPQLMSPGSSGGSSGGWGGGWGGGGGGGGGAPQMTQAQFDAMLNVLGAQSPDLQLRTINLPTFRGKPITPFNGALYNRMQKRLRRGVRADKATVNRQMGNLRRNLRQGYENPYANAQFAQTPRETARMQGLMASTGANPLSNPYSESVNAENAYGQSSDAAFGNLMNVLAAGNREEQRSRLAEVGMNRTEAIQRINAERLGLGTGIDMARGKAKEAWQIRADDRKYQNLLTRQQWNREERMRNQDIRNLERQTEYTTGVETQNSRIQAILDLLGATTGTKVDTAGVKALFERMGWGDWPKTPPKEGEEGEGEKFGEGPGKGKKIRLDPREKNRTLPTHGPRKGGRGGRG